MKQGDIVKSKSTGVHTVVGALSPDGHVLYGYRIKDRQEVRLASADVEVVYSTEEYIKDDT